MAVKENDKDGILVKGTSKADSIVNYGSKVTIIAGKGNDSVFNDATGNRSSISGDADNDSISNYDGANILFKYNSGDGNDIIYGFQADSTLSIGGGKVIFDGVSKGDKFNINGKIYTLGNSKLK